MRPLPREFYARPAAAVARDLLGKVLVRRTDGGEERRLRITEAEAYVGTHDLASHASKGRTRRNASMFGPPGHAYVYFVYGMHDMLNIVTSAAEDPQAVLVRSGVDPATGQLRAGPGLVARHLSVARALDGHDLLQPPLWVEDGPRPRRIEATARIGVGYAREWRGAPLRFLDGAVRPRIARERHETGHASWGAMDLAAEPCRRVRKETPPLARDAVRQLAPLLPEWKVRAGSLERELKFKAFAEARSFVDRLLDEAEAQDHHPDLEWSYTKVKVAFATHAIGGLSRNDFIMAARADRILGDCDG